MRAAVAAAVAAVVVALAAVVGVNVLLLDYGGARRDPVGRLSPVAGLLARTVKTRPLLPAPAPAPVPDQGGHAHGSDD
jgi:hypothetical protein